MEISGLVKTSLIDYPGKIAAVIFTQGCNFRCGFCHNPDLITRHEGQLKETEILAFLKTRYGKLEAVVITGGEPTIQPDLIDFVKKLKKMNYFVKLDTNGSNPVLLMELIDKKLIDYIAMDIKGPLEEYQKISKYLNTKVIQDSINIIKKAGINYEFRTTVLPTFHKLSDFHKVGELVKTADLYTIQGFRSHITLDPGLVNEKSFTQGELEKIASIMKKYVKKVVVHSNITDAGH